MEEDTINAFLDRFVLPEEGASELKALFADVAQTIESFTQTIELLEAQIATLRRFQYGQRSERLKKKQ